MVDITSSAKNLMNSAQNRDWVGSMRPLDVYLNYRQFSLPTSAVDAASRLERNSVFFLSNYVFTLLVTYFYAVVFHPALFFSFLFTIMGLIGLEYIKQNTYKIGAYTVNHSARLTGLAVISLIIIFWTAGYQVFVITFITSLCFLLHCFFHNGQNPYTQVSQQDDLDIDVEAANINNISINSIGSTYSQQNTSMGKPIQSMGSNNYARSIPSSLSGSTTLTSTSPTLSSIPPHANFSSGHSSVMTSPNASTMSQQPQQSQQPFKPQSTQPQQSQQSQFASPFEAYNAALAAATSTGNGGFNVLNQTPETQDPAALM